MGCGPASALYGAESKKRQPIYSTASPKAWYCCFGPKLFLKCLMHADYGVGKSLPTMLLLHGTADRCP